VTLPLAPPVPDPSIASLEAQDARSLPSGGPAPVGSRGTSLLTALLLVAALVALPTPAQADTLGGRSALEVHAEQHILAGHQQARRDPGSFGARGTRTPELIWSSELARLARASSDRMASRAAMGHDPRVGDTLAGTRHGDNVGYRSAGSTSTAAAARAHASNIVKAWMASSGHRANILDGSFTHVGVGVSIGSDGRFWATVVFQGRGLSTAGITGPSATSIDGLCPATGSASRVYGDVDGVHTQAIECLSSRNILNGTAPGTFEPYRALTRAQTAMLLDRTIRASGHSLPAPLRGAFADVGSASTSGPSIERLAAAGIVTGSSSGRFDPDVAISRAELAKMLEAVVIYLDGDPVTAPVGLFGDVPTTLQHANAINGVGVAGLIAGDTSGRFRPDDALQRDQAASVLARFLAWRS
jgi:uncharacterized protein YkwD